MLVVDVSRSGEFGTAQQMKRDVAAELCAVLAFSALQNNDKVGVIFFSDIVEKFIRRKKGARISCASSGSFLIFSRRTNERASPRACVI